MIKNATLVDRRGPTTSPFIPGTKIQFAWDSTTLGLIKTCPRLYYYTMIEGYQTKDESIHLRFGIEYHLALQEYDMFTIQDKTPRDTAIREVVRRLLIRTKDWVVDRDSKAGQYKHPLSLLRSVVWYLDHWQDDRAKTYVLEDGRPAVELSFRFEVDWSPAGSNQPYLLCGHLDRVVDFEDFLYVMDRKTTTYSLGEYYYNQFEPNNQMTLYTIASQIVLDAPIRGVIIDAAQLLKDATRFGRATTIRTQDQLHEWTGDLRYWLTLAESFAKQNYWPMNDTACDKFGGCRFRGICSKSPKARSAFLRGGFIQLAVEDRWNPLKPR